MMSGKPIRIVFEKGVELHCIKDIWFIQSTTGKQSSVSPQEITKKYGIRPVLETLRISPGIERTSLLPAKRIGRLSEELSEIQTISLQDMSFLHVQNLGYIMGALYYHCEKLVEIYTKIWYSGTHSTPPISVGEHYTLAYEPEPFYEFDALITVARRSYNTIGHFIWNAFNPKKGNVPDNFERTIELCRDNLPLNLLNRLDFSHSQFGTKVTEYRDCIQHCNPVFNWTPHATMEQIERGIWGASILIPDNPQERSPKKFKYDSRIDALTYGWELTTEIFEVAREILKALPQRVNEKVSRS
jgi:hypothetical protein